MISVLASSFESNKEGGHGSAECIEGLEARLVTKFVSKS